MIACGLLEVAKQVSDREKGTYIKAAVKILKAIDEKRANWDRNCDAIVQKCSGAYHSQKHHFTMSYADYFFIEAIYKLKDTGILLW